MIPTFSAETQRAAWEGRVRRRTIPLVDFERGSAALGDTSEVDRTYDWTAIYEDGSVYVYREDIGDRTLLITRPDISSIGLAFDQSMRPYLCFTDPEGSWLWYYSAADDSMVYMQLPGATHPCITLDDKRPLYISDSDVIVSYMVGTTVCCRVQREQFSVEHVLGDMLSPVALTAFSMTKGLRLQWRFREQPTG